MLSIQYTCRLNCAPHSTGERHAERLVEVFPNASASMAIAVMTANTEFDRTPDGAILIDGKRTALELREKIAAELKQAGNPPITLATVLVGEDPPSRLYINMKAKAAQQTGMRSKHVHLPTDIAQGELEDRVRRLAEDPAVHGILVQLPLPEGLDAKPVIELLPPEKDADGLTEKNLGRLVTSRKGLVPCTPLGVMRLIERYGIDIRGKRAVVLGRSTLVGLPQVLLLGARGADATVTLAHSHTRALAELTREADLLIAAAGSAGIITRDHVKPGAAVFDVGVTRTDAGVRGDVDFDAVQHVAGAITPMPGGTGPMTVACLLENTLTAARMQGAL